MRKPRSDAKLLNLPEEQQAQLSDWLLSGIPYHTVKQMVFDNFKVATSLGALNSFYNQFCSASLIARRQRAVTTASEIAQEAESKPGRFDSATIDALKQKAFELSINPGSDPRDVKSLFMLVLKARDQQLDQDHLALDRDKFQFDAAKACLEKLPELKTIAADRGLGEQAKLDAIRKQLFGEVPS
jgi:hypothetical protein